MAQPERVEIAVKPDGRIVPPQSAGRSRLEWIDQARGLALILVILYHANSLLRFGYEPLPALTAVYAVFVPFRMPLLMFLSGFIAFYSLSKPPRTFFAGKLSTLAWPYLVWTVVHYFGVGERYTIFSTGLYLSYLWFIAYLFLYYVMSWLLRDVARIPLIISTFLIAAIIPGDINAARRFFFLWGVFLLGELAHRHLNRFTELLKSRSILILLVPTVASAAFAATGAPMHYEPMFVFGVLAGILLACAAFLNYGKYIPAAASRTLTHVGRNSVVFYVTHFPVIFFTIAICSANEVGPAWAVCMIAVLAAISVAEIFCFLRARSRLVAALFEFPRRERSAQSRVQRTPGSQRPASTEA